MKTIVLVLFTVLLFGPTTQAQEPPVVKPHADSLLFNGGLEMPESLQIPSDWKPDYKFMQPVKKGKTIAEKSVIEVDPNHLPERVKVLDNNSLRLNGVFNVSNGQAWNWGPMLDSHLDARTLSFPMRR